MKIVSARQALDDPRVSNHPDRAGYIVEVNGRVLHVLDSECFIGWAVYEGPKLEMADLGGAGNFGYQDPADAIAVVLTWLS